MGKLLRWRDRCFTITTGGSAGLNWGPQTLNGEPWQAINLGVNGAPCAVQLNEPGTYLLLGRIHFGGNFQAGDEVLYGMMDAEQEYEIGDTALFLVPRADSEWEQEFTRIHTINSPRNIFLFATNMTANRGGVIGIRTGIRWVRLN